MTLFSKTGKGQVTNSVSIVDNRALSRGNFGTGETIKEAGQGLEENRFRVSAEDGGGRV